MLLAFLFSLSSGVSDLGATEIIRILFNNSTPELLKDIFFQFRLPKTFTAILAGMALSVSGLLMQTLFRNPLAGPYVLGITGGSNLMVALLVMGTTAAEIQFTSVVNNIAVPVSAAIGALIALFFILLISIKVHSSVSLLLAGLMLGFIYGSIQNILEFLASPEAIKRFTLWSMGSLGNVSIHQLFLLSLFVLPGFLFAFFLSKQLDVFMLGDDYSTSLGINLNFGCQIFLYPVSNPENYGVIELTTNDEILSIIEKPKNPRSNLAITGLYIFDNSFSETVIIKKEDEREEYKGNDYDGE